MISHQDANASVQPLLLQVEAHTSTNFRETQLEVDSYVVAHILSDETELHFKKIIPAMQGPPKKQSIPLTLATCSHPINWHSPHFLH